MSYLDTLVTFVRNPQLLGDLVVVSHDARQFLFDLGLRRRQIHVDGGQFVDAGAGFLVQLFSVFLATESLKFLLNSQRFNRNITLTPS